MFTEALSADAKTWSQPECLSREAWTEALRCTQAQRSAAQPRQGRNGALCNSTGGLREHQARRIKSEDDKYHMVYHTYTTHTWNLIFKNDTNGFIFKTEAD